MVYRITNRPKDARKGFTLIELLLVMVLAAMLGALIFPALARSRQSAQRVRCISNLRQLGLAALFYFEDHEGRAFPYRGSSTNGGDVFWFGWLQRGREGDRTFDPTAGFLYPYLRGRGIEVCPSLLYRSAHFKLKAGAASYGYGYNLLLSGPADQPGVQTGAISAPNATAIFADAAQVNTFQFPATVERPMLEEFYYLSTNEATVHFRHSRLANVVFCDGHVAPESPLAGSLDKRLKGEVIGRIDPNLLLVK